jgi:hypothetical protein
MTCLLRLDHCSNPVRESSPSDLPLRRARASSDQEWKVPSRRRWFRSRWVIEMAPIWNLADCDKGVVCEGSVGAKWLGRYRSFRYEVRCWRDGSIPDATEAVQSPQRLSDDPRQVASLLELSRHSPPAHVGPRRNRMR